MCEKRWSFLACAKERGMHQGHENKIVVGATLCVSMQACVCVCARAERLAAGRHGRGASHFLLGCSCKSLSSSFLAFLFLSSLTPLHPVPVFPSLPSRSLSPLLLLCPVFPLFLPFVCTVSLSLSYFTVPPSSVAPFLLKREPCHCSIRVEPLSCSRFIHMERPGGS